VIQALQSDVEQKEEEVQSLASKLAVATEENSTLSGEREELSAHLTRMEAGRHDLLEQKSELEESLDETFRDLEAANERLHELEETLEATRIELDVLLASKETYQHAADREAALELQLREQHLAFEERLNEIRNILGLKFTAVISSEVQHKFRNVEMPMSFRVPLLTTKIV
jgi:chromosome segregation ATPase